METRERLMEESLKRKRIQFKAEQDAILEQNRQVFSELQKRKQFLEVKQQDLIQWENRLLNQPDSTLSSTHGPSQDRIGALKSELESKLVIMSDIEKIDQSKLNRLDRIRADTDKWIQEYFNAVPNSSPVESTIKFQSLNATIKNLSKRVDELRNQLTQFTTSRQDLDRELNQVGTGLKSTQDRILQALVLKAKRLLDEHSAVFEIELNESLEQVWSLQEQIQQYQRSMDRKTFAMSPQPNKAVAKMASTPVSTPSTTPLSMLSTTPMTVTPSPKQFSPGSKQFLSPPSATADGAWNNALGLSGTLSPFSHYEDSILNMSSSPQASEPPTTKSHGVTDRPLYFADLADRGGQPTTPPNGT
eukprot:GILJ01026807.1.p1 GENE.GILJ01026807.1~~GILJ01026807.1.p1  ORF type:complete len:398 (+),score=84.78 GILJ01026807.1:115-1194(+)